MSLFTDLFAYVNPNGPLDPGVSGDSIRNEFYGPHVNNLLAIYRNKHRVSGGNPVMLIIHGGSWEANDYIDFTEGNSSASLGHYIYSYLLDSDTHGTTAYFDVVALEYSCHSHDRIHGSTISQTYVEAVSYRSGPNSTSKSMVTSYATYNGQSVDDIQRAVQWVRDNATFYGWNANKIVAFGHSVGGHTLLNAAFTPSRPWNAHDTRPFASRSRSFLRGVVVWSPEVDLDPWFMFNQHTKNLTGLVESDVSITGVRGDLERKYLISDSTTGLYPQGSLKTEACKAMSPVDVIRRYGPKRRDLKVRSYYLKNFGTVTSLPPPYAFGEETVTWQGDYTSIPPYNASGHDWRQRAFLDAACTDAGVTHTGEVLDGANFTLLEFPPGSPTAWAPDLGMAWASTMASTYAWAVEAIA